MKLLNNLYINYKKVLQFLIPLSVSLVLIIKWFNEGQMLAAAEDGLPFYNVKRTILLSKGMWHEIDMGLSTPLYVTRIPVLHVASLLENIGISPVYIQAIILGFIIFFGIYFSFRIFKTLSNEENNLVPFIASFFYIFNLFVLSQVMSRFVYSLIFLWALLPTFLYFYIKWAIELKLRYLTLLILVSTLFSWAYLIVSPIFVLWGTTSAWVVANVNKDNYKKLLKSFLIGFSLWIVCSLWWVIPFFNGSKSTQVSAINHNSSILSLTDVSKYFLSNEIFVLKQSFYFESNNSWSEYYSNNDLLNFILILFFYLVILGIVSSSWNSTKKFFLILLIFGWFLVKGANPPLGISFYETLFELIPITQAIRNPYEKVGLIFLLGYAYFVSIGFVQVFKLVKVVNKKLIYIVCTLLMFFLTYPYWNETLFWEYRVRVPVEYKEVDKLIVDKWQDFRILHMPYATTGDAKLKWAPKLVGYNEFLFENPSIPTPILQGNEMFYRFLGNYTSSRYFTNILSSMNVCCVLLHNDTVLDTNYLNNYSVSETHINSYINLTKHSEFGNLKLYKLGDNLLLDRVYLSKSLIKVDTYDDMFELMTTEKYSPIDTVFLVRNSETENEKSSKSEALPKYKVVKNNDNKYSVTIIGSKEPFVLVLSNNFDNNWRLYVNGSALGNGFKVNGFANGWLIDRKGDYTIDISYQVWPWIELAISR